MNFFYWLLARCQTAVWNLNEIMAAYHAKDWVALRDMDLEQARSDIKYLVFMMATGYGPVIP